MIIKFVCYFYKIKMILKIYILVYIMEILEVFNLIKKNCFDCKFYNFMDRVFEMRK